MKLLSLSAMALAGLALSAPAAAQDEKVAPAIAAPAAGKGQVVFYRPGGMGQLIRCTVRENGKMIARVGNGKYYVMASEPGARAYTAKTEATDSVRVEVEPDETTYVKCKISMGIMAGRPNLSPSDAAEFAKLGKKLKPVDIADMQADIAKDEAKASTGD